MVVLVLPLPFSEGRSSNDLSRSSGESRAGVSTSNVANLFTLLGSVFPPEKSTVAASSSCSSGTDASCPSLRGSGLFLGLFFVR